MKVSEDASGAVLEFTEAMETVELPEGGFNLVTGGGRPCGETPVSRPRRSVPGQHLSGYLDEGTVRRFQVRRMRVGIRR